MSGAGSRVLLLDGMYRRVNGWRDERRGRKGKREGRKGEWSRRRQQIPWLSAPVQIPPLSTPVHPPVHWKNEFYNRGMCQDGVGYCCQVENTLLLCR